MRNSERRHSPLATTAIEPRLCSRKHAARTLAVSLSTLDSLWREGALSSVKCRGRRLIDIASIETYLGNHRGTGVVIGDGCTSYLGRTETPIKTDQRSNEDVSRIDMPSRSKLTRSEAVRVASMLLDFLLDSQDQPATDVRRRKRRNQGTRT